MQILRLGALLALLVGIALVPRVVNAQPGPSDVLSLTITERNSTFPDPPYTNNVLPPATITIPETTGETGFTAIVAPIDIDFREAQTSQPSDRLHINQYQINVQSDSGVPLPPRPGAVIIPASAQEVFLPLSIFADSDGNPTSPNGESDTLNIYQGFYGQPAPVPVFSATLTEPPEGPAEFVPFTLPGVLFDIVEEDGTGISDYVDLSSISGFFISSDNPLDYESLPPIGPNYGFIIEDFVNGNGIHYSLGFVSDTEVPEPGSLVLLGAGVLAALLGGRGRLSRKTAEVRHTL